jgi:hypothetical protein
MGWSSSYLSGVDTNGAMGANGSQESASNVPIPPEQFESPVSPSPPPFEAVNHPDTGSFAPVSGKPKETARTGLGSYLDGL